MKKFIKREIYASEISEYLGVKWNGDDFIVNGPSSVKSAEPEKFVFSFGNNDLSNISELLIIAKTGSNCKGTATIYVEDPENAFYQVLNEFFMDHEPPIIHKEAYIAPSAKIARGVSIGKNSYIGPEVNIGANTTIGIGVVIKGNVTIGNNCIIKDNAVIGSEGYHFIDSGTSYLEKPCLGHILINDNVLIGSNTSIELPLFDDTTIGSHVKIDDLVNIGSNCFIDAKTCIAASCTLCHRVVIDKNCFLGARAVIRDDIVIGTNSIIGIGSVVLNNVERNKCVAGNPAREI